MASRWSTKEEALNDFAIPRGRVNDLEGHYVYGNAPPPTQFEEADEEDMQYLFGDSVNKNSILDNEGPDLHGITDMLRMVQNRDGENSDEENTAPNGSNCVITISKMSSLNPNVKEFIPNIIAKLDSESKTTKTDIDNKEADNYDLVNIKKITPEEKNIDTINGKEINEINNEKKIDSNPVGETCVKDDIKKLRNQISNAAKSDTYEAKKQKNVAIASLLRFCSSNNASPTLLTPEYFEGANKDHGDSEAMVLVTTPKSSTTPNPQTTSPSLMDSKATLSSSIDPIKTSASSLLELKSSSTPSSMGKTYTISNRSSPTSQIKSSDQNSNAAKFPLNVPLDPEIKKSIEKVNQWMEEPKKRKSHAVPYVGPISFKRKEPKAASTVLTSIGSEKSSKVNANSQQYQPSNYAADLGKKYLERSKIINNDQPVKVNSWTDLDIILKEKDTQLQKRMEECVSGDTYDSEPTHSRACGLPQSTAVLQTEDAIAGSSSNDESYSPQTYQLPKYSAALEKAYAKKNKKKLKPLNMWTDLNVILREKDKEIKAKIAASLSSNDSDSPQR